MAAHCGCCTNQCGCGGNQCGCGQRRPEPRREGCGCDNDNFQLIPHTEGVWKGYVWYEVEVNYDGPYFEPARRPEPRNGGCGCGCR